MTPTFATFPTPFARWSRWVGIFSVQLILAGVLLHRVGWMGTPLALNLFKAAIAGAAVALVLGLIAAVLIWRRGRSGSWSAATGVLVGLAIFVWPAAYAPHVMRLPELNDVTTDPIATPRFINLAKQRPKDANRVEYAAARNAHLQMEHYPDLKPVVVQRPITEVHEIVGDTMRRLRWSIVAQEPAQGRGRPGYFEAVDRTLVMGFYDDVVVRLDGDQRETRIDVRSASRYGHHDLGRNANRVRRFYRELQQQLETNVPGLDRRRRRRTPQEAVPKRPKGAPVAAQGQQSGRDPAQPGARRAPPPKEKQRAKGEAQAPGKRPVQ